MLKSDLIVCGGRKDGSLFFFDLKRSKEIGCIVKHSSTVIDLKFSEQLFLTVDIFGIVNLFQVEINSGEINLIKLNTFKENFGNKFLDARFSTNDNKFLLLTFDKYIKLMDLQSNGKTVISFQSSIEMSEIKHGHVSFGYITTFVFVHNN